MKSLKIIFSLFLALGFVTASAQDDLYYTPDYTESYVDGTGDTYVTNNFYGDADEDYVFYEDDDYDYYYSSRIRRFSPNRSYRGYGYFDDVYTNRYFYDRDPFFYGYSIYDRPSYSWGVRNFTPGWSNVFFIGNGFSIFPYWSNRRFNRWNSWNRYNSWNSFYTPSWAYSGFYNNPYFYGSSFYGNSYYNNYFCPGGNNVVNNFYNDGNNGLANNNVSNTYYGPRANRANLGGFSSESVRANKLNTAGTQGKFEGASVKPTSKPSVGTATVGRKAKPSNPNAGSASKPGTVYQKPSVTTIRPSNSKVGNNSKPATQRPSQVTRPPVYKPSVKPNKGETIDRKATDDYERVQRANRTRMQEDRKAREQRLLQQMREWQRDNERTEQRQQRANEQRARDRQMQQQQQRRDRQRQQHTSPSRSNSNNSYKSNSNSSRSMSDRARSSSSRSSSRSSGSSRSSSGSRSSRGPR